MEKIRNIIIYLQLNREQCLLCGPIAWRTSVKELSLIQQDHLVEVESPRS